MARATLRRRFESDMPRRSSVGAFPYAKDAVPTLVLIGGAAVGTYAMLKGSVMLGCVIMGASLVAGASMEGGA